MSADAVRAEAPGVDLQNRAAIGLRIVKKDECEGESQRRSTLRLIGETFEVVPHETLGENIVRFENKKYVWTDRELSLEIDTEADGLYLRFTSAGTPLVIVCRPDGETARCEKVD